MLSCFPSEKHPKLILGSKPVASDENAGSLDSRDEGIGQSADSIDGSIQPRNSVEKLDGALAERKSEKSDVEYDAEKSLESMSTTSPVEPKNVKNIETYWKWDKNLYNFQPVGKPDG